MSRDGWERRMRQRELNRNRDQRIRRAVENARKGNFDDFTVVEAHIEMYGTLAACDHYSFTTEELAGWRTRYRELGRK